MADPTNRCSVACAASKAYWERIVGRGAASECCQCATVCILAGVFVLAFFGWLLPRSVWIALRAKA